MVDEPKQAQAPSGAPRREGGSGGHGGPGGGHGGPGGPRRGGGPGGPGGGPGGAPPRQRPNLRKKKGWQIFGEEKGFLHFKRARNRFPVAPERGQNLPRPMTR